jgi:hypothetical protein
MRKQGDDTMNQQEAARRDREAFFLILRVAIVAFVFGVGIASAAWWVFG